MGLLLFLLLVISGYLYLKRRLSGKETPEDLRAKSRLGAAASMGVVPRMLGAQSSADLPEPDVRDEIGPGEENVFVMEPKPPPPSHPFRTIHEEPLRLSSVADEVAKKKAAKRKKKKRPVPDA